MPIRCIEKETGIEVELDSVEMMNLGDNSEVHVPIKYRKMLVEPHFALGTIITYPSGKRVMCPDEWVPFLYEIVPDQVVRIPKIVVDRRQVRPTAEQIETLYRAALNGEVK